MQFGAEAMTDKHNSTLNSQKNLVLDNLSAFENNLWQIEIATNRADIAALKQDANLMIGRKKSLNKRLNFIRKNRLPHFKSKLIGAEVADLKAQLAIVNSPNYKGDADRARAVLNKKRSELEIKWKKSKRGRFYKRLERYYGTREGLNNEFLLDNKIQRSEISRASRTYERQHNLIDQVIDTQREAIQFGLSLDGTKSLQELSDRSKQYYDQIQTITGQNLNEALSLASNLDTDLNKQYKASYGRSTGDKLVKYASIAELKILKWHLSDKVNNHIGNTDQTRFKQLLSIRDREKNLVATLENSVPYILDNTNMRLGRSKVNPRLSHYADTEGGIYGSLSKKLKLNKYYTKPDALKNFVNQLQTDFLPKYVQDLDRLANNTGADQLTTEAYKLRNIEKETKLQSSLANYSERIDSLTSSNLNHIERKDALAQIKFELDVTINEFSALANLDYVQSFRSPPPGNLELAKSIFGIGRIKDLNNFTRDVIGTPFYDETRNKTLTLFNPHSMLVTMLGDYDGDTISSVFVHKNELEIKRVDAKTHLEYLQTANKPNQDQITDIQQTITRLDSAIAKIDNNLDIANYEQGIRDWTANYLKISPELINDTPVSTLLSYVEQGRGLFDNYMGSVYQSIQPLHAQLKAVSAALGDSTLNDRNQIDNYLNKKGNNFGILKQILAGTSQYDDSLMKVFTQSGKERDVNIRKFITKVGQSKKALELATKYTSKSAGTNLSLDQMAGLQQALGQAGSVILGKTYNTTIGMLYTQAPILALANVLLEDGPLAQQAEEKITSAGGDFNKYLDAARNAKSHAQQMGGFLQGVHQLIRNSIKPKGKIIDVLEKITEYRNEFNAATTKDSRQQAIDKMATLVNIDPLVNLETFISEIETLNDTRNTADVVDRQAKIKTKLGLDESYLELAEKRINSIRQKNSLDRKESFSHGAAEGSQLALAAAYSTKQKLIGQSAKFAYEGLIDDSILPGLEGLMNDKFDNLRQTQKDSINAFTTAAEDYFNNKNKNTSALEIEQQEYLDFINQTMIEGPSSDDLKDPKFDYDAYSQKQYQNIADSDIKQKYLAMQYLNTKSSVDLFAGDTGAKLIQFAAFNNIRDTLYGQLDENTRDLVSTRTDLSSDPISATLLQAMSTGKIDSQEKLSKAYEGLVSRFMEIEGINETQASEKLYQSLLDNTNLIMDANDGSMKDIVEAGKMLFTGTKDSDFSDNFLNYIRSTGVGMQSSTIQNIVYNSKAYNFQNSEEALAKEFEQDFNLEAQDSKKVVDRIKNASNKTLLNVPNAVETTIRNINAGRTINVPKRLNYKNVLKNLPASADIGAEVGLFPLVGLLGNMMATGDVSPEAIQGSIGGMITGVSYATNTNKAGQAAFNFGIGTAFKARMGLAQADPVAGLANIIGQELAFAVGGSQITGKASNFIANNLLGRPKNSLDFDKYEGTRNFTANILGGAVSFLATGLMTKFFSNTIAKATSAYSAYAPVVNLVSAQIKAAATAFNQARATGVTADAVLDLSITNQDEDVVVTVDDLYYTIENHDVDHIDDQDQEFEESVFAEEEEYEFVV